MAKTYRVDITSTSKGNFTAYVECEESQATLIASLAALAASRQELLDSYGVKYEVSPALYDDLKFVEAVSKNRKVIFKLSDFTISVNQPTNQS